jgi:hypothetical protein
MGQPDAVVLGGIRTFPVWTRSKLLDVWERRFPVGTAGETRGQLIARTRAPRTKQRQPQPMICPARHVHAPDIVLESERLGKHR